MLLDSYTFRGLLSLGDDVSCYVFKYLSLRLYALSVLIWWFLVFFQRPYVHLRLQNPKTLSFSAVPNRLRRS